MGLCCSSKSPPVHRNGAKGVGRAAHHVENIDDEIYTTGSSNSTTIKYPSPPPNSPDVESEALPKNLVDMFKLKTKFDIREWVYENPREF